VQLDDRQQHPKRAADYAEDERVFVVAQGLEAAPWKEAFSRTRHEDAFPINMHGIDTDYAKR
jgi:hypothetical protein